MAAVWNPRAPRDMDRTTDYRVKTISGLYGMVKNVEHQALVAQSENVAWFYLLNTSDGERTGCGVAHGS